MERSRSVLPRSSLSRWKDHRDQSPVHCPYFYDREGRIQKSNNSDMLLRIKYAMVPPAHPMPMIPGVVPAASPQKRPASRTRVKRPTSKAALVDYGLRKEVFVMENGVEVSEYQRFPGFRYLLQGSSQLEVAKFWKACRTHLTKRNYRHIFLSDGTRVRGLDDIPPSTKIVFVSATEQFRGMRFRPDYDPAWSANTSFVSGVSHLHKAHRRSTGSLLIRSFSSSPVRTTYSVKDLVTAQKRL